MADVFGTVAGAGTKSGVDWDNAIDQSLFNTLGFDGRVAGDTFWFEADTYTLTEQFQTTSTVVGTFSNIISYIAVNKTTHIDDGSRAIFDANSTWESGFWINNTAWYRRMKNVECINGTGAGFRKRDENTTRYWYFENCAFDNNGLQGANLNATRTIIVSFNRCTFDGNSSDGCASNQISNGACFSHAFNNGSEGINIGSVTNCISHNNTHDGYELYGEAVNCTADGNGGSGILIKGNTKFFFNNRLTNNSLYGIGSTLNSNCDNNYFYNNTSGTYQGSYGFPLYDTVSVTGDGYTDRANDNFTLVAGEAGTAVAIPVGLADEADNIVYQTQGMQPLGGGGSGGGQLIDGSLID